MTSASAAEDMETKLFHRTFLTVYICISFILLNPFRAVQVILIIKVPTYASIFYPFGSFADEIAVDISFRKGAQPAESCQRGVDW